MYKIRRSNTVLGVRMNACSGGDLIRNLKSYAVDVLRQTIGILLHDPVKARAVGVIDPQGQCVGDTILLQIDQRIPQIPLFLHLHGNLTGLI